MSSHFLDPKFATDPTGPIQFNRGLWEETRACLNYLVNNKVQQMQSTKLQPLQLTNPQEKGSPGIVPQGEGPQIHVQQSPLVTTPIGNDESGTFCHVFW